MISHRGGGEQGWIIAEPQSGKYPTLFSDTELNNFRAEQRVSSNPIGQAVPYMTLNKPLQAVYIKPKWLPVAGWQTFPMRRLRNLALVPVPKSMQYATKYGVKI